MKLTISVNDDVVAEATAAAQRINDRRAENERLPGPITIDADQLREAVHAYLKAFILQDLQQAAQRLAERAALAKMQELDAAINPSAQPDSPVV